MQEKVPRTFYSLEQLQEEAKRKQEKNKKMKKQANKAKQ